MRTSESPYCPSFRPPPPLTAYRYYNGANPSGEQTTNPAAGMMRTPHLDQLASEGIKLESYYVQPLCTPTRATIMTGRYPSHTGMGPDVLVENVPYGVPGREVFVAEYLKKAGYMTHAVGKWHLGACDARYMPTYRGFDSFQGYMHGAEGYWNHAGDFRNSSSLGSSAGETPHCSTKAEVNGVYSGALESAEVARIVAAHDSTKPLFVYLALHSVHGPNEDPYPLVDVNATFPEIVAYDRRIFAGMVLALDMAVANVTQAYKAAGLWADTVVVFSTDNGGIGSGNNFPLRGCKVLNWEGGVHGIGFVRGTDSALAPVPAGGATHELFHTTDWLPTLVGLAGGDTAGSALPLDGVDQWPTISTGAATPRKFIIHNLPITADPVLLQPGPDGKGGGYSTSVCLSGVDSRAGAGKGGCHAFGVTGGAIRVGDYKLLVSHVGRGAWEDSSPAGVGQGLPGGRYPNRSAVFTPAQPTGSPPDSYGNVYDGHLKRNVTLYLFNIKLDPTESNNIANTSSSKLKELLDFYNSYAAKSDTVMGLSWRYGFQDPDAGTAVVGPDNGQACAGAFNRGPHGGSQYCHYGREWECNVDGREPAQGSPVASVAGTTTAACQAACATKDGCAWWVLRNGSADGGGAASSAKLTVESAPWMRGGGGGPRGNPLKCELHGASAAGAKDCSDCAMGPKVCPGMAGAPSGSTNQRGDMRGVSPKTVNAFVGGGAAAGVGVGGAQVKEDVIAAISRLDASGYFSGRGV